MSADGRIFYGLMLLGGAYVLGIYSWAAVAVGVGSAPPATPITINWAFFAVLVGGALFLEIVYSWILRRWNDEERF